MLPLEAANLHFLQTSTLDELSQWLLSGSGLKPVWYTDDRSNASHLVDTYQLLDSDNQKKLSTAIVNATLMWDRTNHTTDSLYDLAFASVLINNEEIIPYLVGIIDNQKLIPQDGDNFRGVVATIVGCETPIGKEAVSRWYDTPSFDWHCMALLCMGTVDNNPDNAPDLIPKLLQVMDDHPDYFAPGFLVYQLSEFIGPENLTAILKTSPLASAKLLLSKLTDQLRFRSTP